MLASVGERDAPRTVARVRRRCSGRIPLLVDRCSRLLRLADVASHGPDPEEALPQLEAARRALAAFLKLTPAIAVFLS